MKHVSKTVLISNVISLRSNKAIDLQQPPSLLWTRTPSNTMPPKHARRKANHRKQAVNNNTSATEAKNEDPLHNRDHPNSKRLQRIADKIFDVSSKDAFAVIVRDYLLTTTTVASHQESPPAKKKKRKKKKKSKGSMAQDEPENETFHEGTDTPEASPTTAAVGNPSGDVVEDNDEPPISDGMCIPRERLTQLWNEHLFNSTYDSMALQRSRDGLERVASRFSARPMSVPLVDSVARPFLKQEMIERRMDRVAASFVKRFSPSAKATTAADQLGAFLRHCCSEPEQPFFVPLKSVQEAVNEIACPACRRDAQLVLEQSHNTHQLDLDGAMFETTMDDYEKNDYELDSMYQIMEEGSLPLRDLPKWRFEAAQINDEKGWRLSRPFDDSVQLSTVELEFLLKHGLLAMGLPDETLFPQDNEGAVLDVAVGSVDEQINGLFACLEKIERWVKEAVRKVNEGKPTEEVMDLNSFDHLKQADEKCDLVLNDLLGIAITVSRAVNYVQAQYGRDPLQERHEIEANVYWATKQCSLLWKTFLCCLESVLEQMNTYEGARFATAGHRGNLEEMYISLQGRRLYFAYVRQKVKMVDLATAMIRDRLLYPTQLGNNSAYCSNPVGFIFRLFMEQEYFRSSGHKPRGPHNQIDQAFADVMTVLREIVETVHAANTERIVQENHMRWSKLWRVAGGMQECLLQAKASAAKSKHSGHYEKQLHEICQKLEATLDASEIKDTKSHADRVRVWRKQSCHDMKSLMESWSNLATFAVADSPVIASPVLSRFQLERVLSASHLDAVSIRYGNCRGGKGASRLVAGLMGITFEFVMEKFREYQSLTAMQELLDDAATNCTIKKNNKKKKTKKGNGSQREALSKEDVTQNARKIVFDDRLESDSQAGTSVDSSSSLSQNIPGGRLSTDAQLDTALSTSDDEIGIYDGAVFIRAETFLMGRLDSLLKSENDIIFVSGMH